MRVAKNRERILEASILLFNEMGVVPITTNHIADNLKISPGNLYFHFRNKEEIVRELFDRMCEATYKLWKDESNATFTPLQLLQRSFELFWEYRFFHREMYHLRRKDPLLARRWRKHLLKTVRLLQSRYLAWVKAGVMKKITDPDEMQMIADVVLITSSSFLQFYESRERPASNKAIKTGVRHIARLLLPYHTESAQKELTDFLK